MFFQLNQPDLSQQLNTSRSEAVPKKNVGLKGALKRVPQLMDVASSLNLKEPYMDEVDLLESSKGKSQHFRGGFPAIRVSQADREKKVDALRSANDLRNKQDDLTQPIIKRQGPKQFHKKQ